MIQASSRLLIAPNVLVVHLKRFQFSPETNSFVKNIFPVEFPLLLKIGNDIVSQNQENYLQEQLSQETQNEDVRADEYVQHATYVRSSTLHDSNVTEGKGDEKDTAGGLMKYQKSQIDQINLCNINYKDVARMILKTASLVATSTSTSTSTPAISSAASESISFSRQNAGENTEAEEERSFITKNSKGREKAYLDNEKSEKDDILNVGTERSIKKYEDVIQTQVEEQSCNEKRKIWMTHSSLSTTPPSSSTSISPSIPLTSSIAVARSEMKTGSGSGTGMGTGIGMGVGGKRSPASSVEKSVGMFEDRADIESSLQYRLSAVVRHIGINAFSGHYICDTYSSLRDLECATVKPSCPSLSNPISSIISSTSESVSSGTPARGTTPAPGKGNGGGGGGGGERGGGREGGDGSAGVWHRNNDSLVTEIKEIDVLTDMSSPYIFFYSRV